MRREFATGHPLFAANMAANRIALEAELRLPRKDVPIVLYDNDDGFVPAAAEAFAKLGYSNIRALAGGLQAWRDAGYELFIGRQFLRQGVRRAGGSSAATRRRCRRTMSPP